ncbi:MAG: 4Fe-4S binding protein [Caldilineaceae bacterium]|nr:4Fe-4S binding protein [Caldilineaceae bacterium]
MTDDKPGFPVPIIDASRCTGCGLCVAVCPTGALVMKGAIAIVADPQACAYTGHCERICPTQAISRPFQIVFSPKEETT